MNSAATWYYTLRRVYFHDPDAPLAAGVFPYAFAAVHGRSGALLLVQRRDSGVWELPGGRIDVGESAPQAAVRETAEEAGVAVRITGLVGLFSDPGHVVRGVDGQERQQLAVVVHAEPVGDAAPRPDGVETCAAAWFGPGDLGGRTIERPTWIRIEHALGAADQPHLG